MKLCKKCNTTKEFLEFSKKKSNKDGLNNWCKECNKEYLKNYYLENKDLKLHLESLFIDGMSWENWGEWHIDHKIPVSKFDKETPMSIVNNLNNLQPLWALDNLSKSNKIEND